MQMTMRKPGGPHPNWIQIDLCWSEATALHSGRKRGVALGSVPRGIRDPGSSGKGAVLASRVSSRSSGPRRVGELPTLKTPAGRLGAAAPQPGGDPGRRGPPREAKTAPSRNPRVPDVAGDRLSGRAALGRALA